MHGENTASLGQRARDNRAASEITRQGVARKLAVQASPLSGWGWYIWMISECGTPQEIADLCKLNACGHLLPKIADGTVDYNKSDGDLAKQLTQLAQAAGITVWGWQYVYLSNPKAEADKAVARIHETGCTGFVIDAEGEWKYNAAKAEEYCKRLRSQLGESFPIALSSFRFPSYHPEFPWSTVRPYVNLDMPQVYWEQAHNAGAQLIKSYNEFAAMTPKLPYLPSGATYQWNGWEPTLEDVDDFIETVNQIGLPGYNFWSYQHAKRDLAEIWSKLMPEEPGIGELPQYLIVLTTAGLNVRTGHGTTYTSVGKLPSQVCLQPFERYDSGSDVWYRIGASRWVAAQYAGVKLCEVVL